MIPYSVISGRRKITARNKVITVGTNCPTMVWPVLAPQTASGPTSKNTSMAINAPTMRKHNHGQLTLNSSPKSPVVVRRKVQIIASVAELVAISTISTGRNGASCSLRNCANTATSIVLFPSIEKGTRNRIKLSIAGRTNLRIAVGVRTGLLLACWVSMSFSQASLENGIGSSYSDLIQAKLPIRHNHYPFDVPPASEMHLPKPRYS